MTQPGAELSNTAVLRQECAYISAVIEEAGIEAEILQDWKATLADRATSGHASGGPKTRELDEAISAIAEDKGNLGTFGEALTGLRLAVGKASSHGELTDALGATGHTSGYEAE